MTTNVISSPSNKRWVKLQLEPVEVPVDYDDKLLFSTVQSVVPGAHGLYYRENGKRKALNFDTITGCVQAPDAGWDTKDIYIYLAHGNKHATHYSDYTKASQEFGKNISAVQKLMAAAGFSFEPKLPYAEKPSRTRSRSRGIKSGFEAQPENVHFSEESDGNSVHQLIEQKNKEIEKLLEGNIELKLKLKELKRDLKEQVRTNAELRRVISKSEDEKESSIRNFVQSPTVMSTEVLNEKSFKEREELEELQKILIEYKNNIENSKIIMKGKDEEINKNEKEIAKLRLDLEQTNLALIEQKKRVNNLEEEEASNLKFINNDSTTSEDIEVISTMDSRKIPELEDKLKKTEHEKTGYIEEEKRMDFIKLKDEQINHLTASLKETQKTLEESKNKIQELIEKEEEINNLHSVIADLRSTIAKIKKEKEESEWHLGEHKEWLKNSKEKVLYLENQVNILNGGEPVMEKNSLPVSSTPPKVRSRATSESNDESTKPQIRVLEAKLQLSNNEIRNINLEKEKLQEANWYANERVAKLEKKISYLKETTEELSINNSGITQLIAEKDKRMSEMEEEKSKLEWRIGELNQWWNDAKWKIGELESEVAHQRHLLEKANDKIQNLNEQLVSSFRSSSLSNSSVYSVKQPCLGQWQLASGCISSVPSPTISSIFPVVQPVISTKRVVLGIESSPSTDIFVMGSFLNWQCALRCEYLSNGRKGVSLDLPKGRHEFLFFVNNKWVTSPFYSTVPNVYGGQNNIICIE